jgi:hypothetical protein
MSVCLSVCPPTMIQHNSWYPCCWFCRNKTVCYNF